MIYLDNSATTKPYKEVLETYVTVSEQYFGNPSSLHSLGLEAEKVLTKSREVVAKLLGVQSKEVIFTSGGTEGNNLAIKGIALEHSSRGKHLITSVIEHASSYETFSELEKKGFEVTYLPVNQSGHISIEELKRALRSDTVLVSLIHVNNETGAAQPIEEIGKVLKEYPKVFFHVDHVQGITKVPVHLKNNHIDLCTISGHKFHGVKGTGALYVREGITLSPMLHGGVQEARFRAGTENVPGMAALAKALRMSTDKAQERKDHLIQLQQKAVNGLQEIDGVVVNSGIGDRHAPHIVNFSIPGAKPEVIIQALSHQQVYVSTKSACSSKLSSPSRILMEMGLGNKRAESAIRISFSYDTKNEEIEAFIKVMKKEVPKLLQVMR
ncbi:cysteine desulfurase family protein [Alkalihalobacterium elongatum]|uniref:cysteine desulfurase family protein n=1 Tax=Alkalihalobacterium elongatum TaxID=2675466 RepID=UPI001C2004D3|nr:cysteine desulfurase family protein [Alkalihalobacterium elongatum]